MEMHLRTVIFPHPPPLQLFSLSSAASCPSRIFLGFRPHTALREAQRIGVPVRCSISKIHSYGTVDFERRPPLKWSSLYRQIATMENPGLGPSAVLERWEVEQGRLFKWKLCRVVKELRKFRRFDLALKVFEWMAAQGSRFRFNSSEVAIKLDLIAKVHGVTNAEEYFLALPDTSKDKRTYGALLNVYGQAKMKEKAEATIETMLSKGFATAALPFNVMMTLYMNVGEHEKVNTMISQMKERNVKFDVFTYNIWITNCAAVEDAEEMERVMQLMTSDSEINANWTTYSTLATMYIRFGNHEKAESCLKDVEIRMTGRDRLPFNYLLGLYCSIGKREEVYRVWNRYKSSFPAILNMGYQSMLSSLIKLGDAEGAETIYEEWVSTTSSFDPRICGMIMGCYIRKGRVDKAKSALDCLMEKGGKPRPITWEILAEGYINEELIDQVLSCMKEAVSCKDGSKWRPKPTNIASLLALCEGQNDVNSVAMLKDLLQTVGCLDKEEYKVLFDAHSGGVVHGIR